MATSKYARYYVYIKPVIGNKYVKSFTPYIFSLLSLIVFTIFAIRPTVLTIIELQKNIQDNKMVLILLEQKAKDLTDGKRNLDSISPEIKNKINTKLPSSPAVSNLISSLQTSASNIASVSALQIQPVTIYNSSTNQAAPLTLEELSFSFNIQSSYPLLMTVLDNLGETPRLVNLTSAVLNKTTEGISLSISGKGYHLKQ